MPNSLRVLSMNSISTISVAKNRTVRKKALNSAQKKSKSQGKFVSAFSIFLTVFIIGCFIVYIYLALEMVNINFSLRAKEEVLASLQEENKNLETQIRESFSLQKLEEKAKDLQLVKANDIRYLQFSQGGSLSQAKSKIEN